MSVHIQQELSEHILTITLSRVDKLNSIDNAMYQALAEALEMAEVNADVRVVLFQADGAHFTAGNDIGDFSAIADGSFNGEWKVTRFMKALATATRPVLAAVQGHAVGIGATMLFHCDLVVVADDVLLVAPFVNLALVQEAASSILVPARIGHARAYAMFALGQPIDASDAVALGIANQTAAPAALREAARAMARQLAQRPPGALAAVKQLMRGDPAPLLAKIDAENAVFLARLPSPEAREARAAFAEHRQPDFSRVPS
jgi:enoyl-CoA hydratase/carnithine racemase